MYGARPPEPESVARTGMPTSATCVVDETASDDDPPTVSVSCFESFQTPATLVAVSVTVNIEVPPAVGVPEIVPSVPSLRPAGREPALTVHAPVFPNMPEAVSVAEYGAPTAADGSTPVRIAVLRGAIVKTNSSSDDRPQSSLIAIQTPNVPASVG